MCAYRSRKWHMVIFNVGVPNVRRIERQTQSCSICISHFGIALAIPQMGFIKKFIIIHISFYAQLKRMGGVKW